MATAFPTGLDNLTNPAPGDYEDTPGVLHSAQHINANDAIEALQTKVGINGSAANTTLDYLIKTHLVAADPHTQYQKEIEKGAANGYASLDGSVLVPLAQIPNLPETRITNLVADLASKADLVATNNALALRALDAAVVHATGGTNETITGVKTFSSAPIVPAGSFTSVAISDFTEASQDVIGGLASGGSGLTMTYNDGANTWVFDVNVDSSTIEVNADTLRVKDLGITGAKLAAALPQGKINSATVTSNSAATSGTTELSLASFTSTFTTGRKGILRANWRGFNFTVATDIFELRLYQGATQVAGQTVYAGSTAATTGGGSILTEVSGNSASNLYDLRVVRIAGTGTATLQASATTPTQIRLDDTSN
jgi:hypothetical protein